MRWAIGISVALHIMALSLVFVNGSREKGYPVANVIRVNLASPPAARGVAKPAVDQTTQAKSAKVEKQIETPRVAEINQKKKPKKQPAKPEPAIQKNETPDTETHNKNKGLPQGVELGSAFGSARLDASGFDSPYYLNILFSKIDNQWDNPYEGDQGIQCTIYFVVGRDGKIIDSAIEKSSGISAYDQAALRAILGCKPPPLPNQFDSEELGIHLEFSYTPYQ